MTAGEDGHPYKDACRLIFLCLTWYSLSAGGNIVVKTLLNEFPYPLTVCMVQLVSVTIYLPPILRCWQVRRTEETISSKYYLKMILPLAFGKLFASASAQVSLWKVPVSYAHTVKASLPLFTVVLSRILLREKQTYAVYASLMPIVLGVAVATVTEISFDLTGLISALCATGGFAFLNIFSKKCLKETGIHHLRLLLMLARISSLMFFPIWLVLDVRRILQDPAVLHPDKLFWSISLLVVDGLSMFGQNVVAFTVIAMVTPLSYAVANASKRIVVVCASLILLRNPVTSTNLLGMLMAILGVLGYNKAKYDQNMAKRKENILPYIRSTSNLQDGLLHLSPLNRNHSDFDIHNHFHLQMPNGLPPGGNDHSNTNGGMSMYSKHMQHL